MSNRYLNLETSKLLRLKLEKLASNLNQGIGVSSNQTYEQVISEAIRLLNTFYRDLKEPSFTYEQLYAGNLPDPDFYNKVFQGILDDLTIIFAELENTETISVANFNYIATEYNRVLSHLKRLSSKVGTYALYAAAPTDDYLYFGDSFNNSSKIEIGSPLLNQTECNLNQDEGIITLPINIDKTRLIKVTQAPIINPNSNGVAGNNRQIGALARNDINTVLDNNPDTWFEYEFCTPVTKPWEQRALILDLTINLGEETIINQIVINPNNFGTKASVYIDTIETSIDGKVYTNIKDEVSIAGFSTVDEENKFILAPSTSKFAGKGIYTLTPRKVKYIHLVFRQTDTYIINTVKGDNLRYAIGLRDIDIYGLVFDPVGEIVSKEVSFSDEVKKVSLETIQNPSEPSELASIDYLLSPNDGQNWYPIQPKSFFPGSGQVSEIPEILNFNTGDDDEVKTSVPVTALRLKAIMKRNDEVFDDPTASFYKKAKLTSELHRVPDAFPFVFELGSKPLPNSVVVADPLFGSCGIEESPYRIKSTGDSKYFLPFGKLVWPRQKELSGGVYRLVNKDTSDWLHVLVNGEEWSHALTPSILYSANYSTDSAYRLFWLFSAEGSLGFGHGYDTMNPGNGANIDVYFDAEELFPSAAGNNHIAKLRFKTGLDKKSFALKLYHPEEETSEISSRGATVVSLKHQNITDYADIKTQFGAGNEKTFLNGRDELTDSNNWSLDTENGILYLETPTSVYEDTVITYTYQQIDTLSEDDWDWTDETALRDSVSIKESGWTTFHREDVIIPVSNNSKVVCLQDMRIVDGTLSISVTSSITAEQNPFVKEVTFIDGSVELGASIRKKVEYISGFSAGASIASFRVKERIVGSSSYPVTFGNFGIDYSVAYVTEKGSLEALTTVGDYYVERDSSSPNYGMITLKPSPYGVKEFHVTYYYTNPDYSDSGLYSVDYKNGLIYTQKAINSSWTVQATYQYTDYRAEYKIAREVDKDNYTVDIANQTVSIKEEEMFSRQQLPAANTPYYQISYEYMAEVQEDVSGLKDYFTPILKDYNLKLITKGKLF